MRYLRGSLILLLIGTGLLLSQTSTGRIRGTVKDPSGAVIPNASVVARANATGIETRLTTNAEGAYTFNSLPIGGYSVTVSASGFSTLQRTDVRVVSGESEVVDLDLAVGDVAQTATVTDELVAVDTTRTTNVTTRVTEEISSLPIALSGSYRNSQAFIVTMTGVNYNPAGTNRRTFDLASINGIPTGGITYNIDGLTSGTQAHEFGDSYAHPLPEAVAEFSVTANTSAEYGWNSGAGINLTMKSGTNQFHGNAFEYFRNNRLDARNWFAARANVQRQNEFGGVIGGPVLVPGVYNGHDKTFFFASYSGYRRTFEDQGRTATVPTTLMRRGDFSELLSNQVVPTVGGEQVLRGQIFDPLSTRRDAAGAVLRTPFPNNVVPVGRLSPISLRLQEGYPLPNRPGTQLNWVGNAQPSILNVDKTTLRVDHLISSAHRLTFSMDNMWRSRQVDGGILNPEIANTMQQAPTEHAYRVNYDWTARPTVLVNFRAGYRRAPRTIGTISLPSNDFGARSGIRGVFTTDTPSVSIQGMNGYGASFQQLTDTGQTNDQSVSLSWNKGEHNFKFGAQFLLVLKKVVGGPGTQGTFSFQDRETGLPGLPAPLTGFGYASYLLGEVDSSSLSSNRGADAFANGAWAFYAQDQWRVTSKLTVNYGIRWDLYLPRTERHDRMSAFDPTVPNPAAGGLLGGATFWGTGPGRNGRNGLHDWYLKALGPRLGFAYQVTPKMVVRAHYGIAYNTLFGMGHSGFSQPSVGWGGTVNAVSVDNGITPAFNWNNGFPPIFPRFPLFDPGIVNGSSLEHIDPTNVRPGRTQNLSFGLERELPGSIAVKAEYIANLSHGMPTRNLVQLNNLDLNYLSLGNLLLADINSPQAQAAGIRVPYPAFRGSVAQALRPYPQFQNIDSIFQPAGDFTYHSMQLNVQKRLGSGLTFLVGYTISKSLGSTAFGNRGDGTAPIQHTTQRRMAKRLTELDRPQSIAISYTYDLPFGPGKRFLGGNNPVLRQIVGGWQVAGIHNYFKGTPVEVSTTASIPTLGPIWALRVPGVDARTDVACSALDPNDPARNRYLNVNAFATPAPFTLGDTRVLPNVRSCGYANENLSILKIFPLNERSRLRVGADFFNIFNRHHWTGLATNIGVPASFGRVSGATDPRYIQFNLKVDF
jgi:hypothetical protein